jgi:hypothetical protein
MWASENNQHRTEPFLSSRTGPGGLFVFAALKLDFLEGQARCDMQGVPARGCLPSSDHIRRHDAGAARDKSHLLPHVTLMPFGELSLEEDHANARRDELIDSAPIQRGVAVLPARAHIAGLRTPWTK